MAAVSWGRLARWLLWLNCTNSAHNRGTTPYDLLDVILYTRSKPGSWNGPRFPRLSLSAQMSPREVRTRMYVPGCRPVR